MVLFESAGLVVWSVSSSSQPYVPPMLLLARARPVRSRWVQLEVANHEPGRCDIENALARKNVGHSIKRLTPGRPGYCWATTHTFVSNNDTTRSRLRPIAPQRPCASPFE